MATTRGTSNSEIAGFAHQQTAPLLNPTVKPSIGLSQLMQLRQSTQHAVKGMTSPL